MQSIKRAYSYKARILFLLLLSLVLLIVVGCSQVKYVDKPVYVSKPVIVPCVKSIPEKPFWETEKLKREDSIDAVSKAYMIELLQRQTYEVELEAIAKTCASVSDGK